MGNIIDNSPIGWGIDAGYQGFVHQDKWEKGPGVHYKVHRNIAVGFLAKEAPILDGDDPAFKTYEMQLQGIPQIFGGQYQHDYDEKHKVLFSNTPEGLALRTAISTEHVQVYNPFPPLLFTREGTLDDFSDFLELLDYGEAAGRRRVFTYALMDDGIYFSQTGAGFSADTISKHAVHANAEAMVRYSGTFRLVHDPQTHEYHICIDNDSGTYRPRESDLPLLEKVLKHNFPGQRPICISTLKPQPPATKRLVGPNESKNGGVYPGKWEWVTEEDSDYEDTLC